MSDDEVELFKSKDALDWKSLIADQSSLEEEIDEDIERDLKALSPPRVEGGRKRKKTGNGPNQKKAKTSSSSSSSSSSSHSRSSQSSQSASYDDDDDVVVLDSPPLRVSGGGKKGAVVIDKEEEEEEDPLQALGIDTKAIEAATRLKLQQQKYQDGGVAKMLWLNNEMINRTRSLDSDENHTTLLLGRNAVQPSIASIVRPNPLDNTNNNTTDPETQLNLTIVNPGFRPESVVLRVHQNLLFHKVIPTLISCGWSNIKDPKSAVFRFDGMNLDMNKSPSDYYLKPEDKLYLRITKSNQPLTVDQEDEQILANLSIPTSGLKGSGGGIGTGEPEKEVNPEDLIRLKLVAASGKGEKFRISKYEPLAKLFDKYCSKHNLDPKTVKFVLDGEALSGKDSPEMLELEDDDSIDVQIKATTSTTTTTRK